MQISLKWVNELVNIETVDLDSLIEKLTLGGFEVEKIFEFEINNEPQLALDISSTANRSDSLSIQGISVEMKAVLNKKSKISPYSLQITDWEQKIKYQSIIGTGENAVSYTHLTLPTNREV
mgnify:CR=1 FL=1